MSRDAVWTLLGTDSILNATYGITQELVFPTFGMDGSRDIDPSKYFIILRWEELIDSIGEVEVLTIWVHRSRQVGRDYVPIKNILNHIKILMESTVSRAGNDGKTMSQARFKGMGGDLVDEGYDTITKYAVFDVNTEVEI